jgi:hypothetical protein
MGEKNLSTEKIRKTKRKIKMEKQIRTKGKNLKRSHGEKQEDLEALEEYLKRI